MFNLATTPDSLGYLGTSGMNMGGGAVGGASGIGGGTGMGLGGPNIGGMGGLGMGGVGIGAGAVGIGAGAVGIGAGAVGIGAGAGNHGKMPPQNLHFQPSMAMPNKPGNEFPLTGGLWHRV